MLDKMTRAGFLALLRTDAQAATRLLFELAVDEWLQDGPEEVVRILALWASRGLEFEPDYLLPASWPRLCFPSEEAILEYAEDKGLIEPEEETDGQEAHQE